MPRLMKSNGALALALALLAGIFMAIPAQSISQADSTVAEQFIAPDEPGLGYFGIANTPDFQLGMDNPYLLGMKTSGNSVLSVHSCSSLTDATCSDSNYWQFSTVMGLCQSTTDTNCLANITATDSSGNALPVNFVQNFPGVRPQDYTGSTAELLPNGQQVPIFEIPGAPHLGGDLYMARVLVVGSKDVSSGETTFNANQIDIGFNAITLTEGSYQSHPEDTDATHYPTKDWRAGGGAVPGCIMNGATQCAQAQPMDLSLKFGVTFRSNFELGAWFHGRFANPDISITDGGNGTNIVSVAANPVITPVVATWKKKTELNKDLADFIAALPKPLGGTGSGGGNVALQNGDPSLWSLRFDPNSFDESNMKMFLLWLPEIGDKATVSPSYWSVVEDHRNLENVPNNGNCQLPPNTINGIVSTNASTYIAGPPTWNGATHTLDYKVAAPHFNADGTVFQGTYDLAMNAKFARCIYGFTSAPVQATVSIESADGTNQVATTVVAEKNGWLYLSAKGFTFSNPTIQVKLTQEDSTSSPGSSVTPAPDASSTPQAAPTQSSTQVAKPSGPAKEMGSCSMSSGWVIGKSARNQYVYLSCGPDNHFHPENGAPAVNPKTGLPSCKTFSVNGHKYSCLSPKEVISKITSLTASSNQ